MAPRSCRLVFVLVGRHRRSRLLAAAAADGALAPVSSRTLSGHVGIARSTLTERALPRASAKCPRARRIVRIRPSAIGSILRRLAAGLFLTQNRSDIEKGLGERFQYGITPTRR